MIPAGPLTLCEFVEMTTGQIRLLMDHRQKHPEDEQIGCYICQHLDEMSWHLSMAYKEVR